MKVYNAQGQEIELFDINSIKNILFSPNPGYEVIHNHSYSLGKLAFISLGIKKTNGVFNNNDDIVGSIDIDIRLGTTFCGLGKGTDWYVGGIGYAFMNSKLILVSDRNVTNSYDRAYINTVCIIP